MGISYNSSIAKDGLLLHLDAANPKSWSQNVHPAPVDMYSWFVGSAGACTISRDTTTSPSPAGGIPLRMDVTANDPYLATYNYASSSLAPAAPGETWTVSVWVKGSVATSGEIFIFGDSATGGNVFTYNDYGATAITITRGWTRVSYTRAFSVAGVARIQVRLDGPNSGGAGQTVWWDGLQVERSSAPTTFNPRTNTNGVTWNDLSGNGNHHTAVGSPAYTNGRFNINETQWFNKASAIPGVTTLGSVVMWYSTTDNQELWVRGNNSGSYYLSASVSNNYYHSSCGSPTNYVDLNVTTRPDSPINYRNGSFHMWEAKNVDFTTWTSYDWFGYGTSWNMTGTLAAILVYDRPLTDQESIQNFNALRGRYGI
jgi:hypothetical protein